MPSSPGRKIPRLLMMASSIVGVLCVSYVLGAAVMKFDWPTASFLRRTFAFFTPAPTPPRHEPGLEIDQPGQTFDGFTLLSTTAEGRAMLVDMKGKVVHEWVKPFSSVWPSPRHVKEPLKDENVILASCRLFPNGDLLAVFEAPGDQLHGYGLAKLDKDSKLIWKYDDNVHGEIDVGEDKRIYALTERIVTDAPTGLEWLPQPYLTDDLVVLSEDGKETKRVRILEALHDSDNYNLLVEQIRNHPAPPPDKPTTIRDRDFLHGNSVRVLTEAMAAKFPKFKAGQVLVSLGELNALIVVDVDLGKIAWACTGPWQGQHSAGFLDNGHLLLLDNRGVRDGARAIEYDPRNQTFPWCVPEDLTAFGTLIGGVLQRLPNGNTLICATEQSNDNSESGTLREVTQQGAVVWLLRCKPRTASAQRYDARDVQFLQKDVRPRPGS